MRFLTSELSCGRKEFPLLYMKVNVSNMWNKMESFVITICLSIVLLKRGRGNNSVIFWLW